MSNPTREQFRLLAGNLRAEMARQSLNPLALLHRIRAHAGEVFIESLGLNATLLQQCCDEAWLPGDAALKAIAGGLGCPPEWLQVDHRNFHGVAVKEMSVRAFVGQTGKAKS